MTATKAWTVMVYLCGDNDLESSAVADVREMKAVGSGPDLNVVVQFDRYHKGPTRRYYLRKGTSLERDAVGRPLGETNTGDPQVLIDFARWAITTYPAQHYMLVVWNHGQGWDDTDVYERVRKLRKKKRLSRTPSRGHVRAVRTRASRAIFATTVDTILHSEAIGFDDHQMDFLDNKEMKRVLSAARRALGRGKRLDIVGLDACLMSMVEILYELRGGAEIALAAEETIPLEGWPYKEVLSGIRDNPGITPRDLSIRIVRDFVASYRASRRVNLSATDLYKVEPLRALVSDLGRQLLSWCRDGRLRDRIRKARAKAWKSLDTPEYVDLPTLCAGLRRYPEVQLKCDDIIDSCRRNGLVLSVKSGGRAKPKPQGVTIWLPEERPADRTMQLYRNLDFVKGSGWGRFINSYVRS